MTTIAPKLYFVPELREYAAKLQAAGFTVYRHKDERMRADGTPRQASYFVYSRTVDGVELFGSVQTGPWPSLDPTLEHSMPIKPSREHGSSMWIALDDEQRHVLVNSVEYAELITRPTNWNALVGTQRNYENRADLERRFVVLEPITTTPTEGA